MNTGEPREPGEAEETGDIEVQPQPEKVAGGVDTQDLLEDAKTRVAGHVEGEQAGWSDHSTAAEPDERAGEREVEDELVEERRVKRVELFVRGRAM